ncbi:hypothetical protein GCM10009839_56430 [Catenulispora yoronensis]|uniref:Class I SAM-dependent methyltransferase n=1 Tax=Catenulispora yoronensis TaxID=450799 RepID=A0ABN2UWQ1_9ACTN
MTSLSREAYGSWFYDYQAGGSASSASRVLPLVFDLVQPRSIVDFGCGTGGWLAAARRLGIDDVRGIDGSWVDEDTLAIPAEMFQRCDLEQRPRLARSFDLALCLEVAEHLAAWRADTLVEDLCCAAEVVLFSAAVPGQTGSHHRNEQWPQYWKAKFAQQDYEMVDCLRARLWHDDAIEPWYIQNIYLYVAERRLDSDPRLQAAASETGRIPLDVIHPRLFGLFSKPFAPADPEPVGREAAPVVFE